MTMTAIKTVRVSFSDIDTLPSTELILDVSKFFKGLISGLRKNLKTNKVPAKVSKPTGIPTII